MNYMPLGARHCEAKRTVISTRHVHRNPTAPRRPRGAGVAARWTRRGGARFKGKGGYRGRRESGLSTRRRAGAPAPPRAGPGTARSGFDPDAAPAVPSVHDRSVGDNSEPNRGKPRTWARDFDHARHSYYSGVKIPMVGFRHVRRSPYMVLRQDRRVCERGMRYTSRALE